MINLKKSSDVKIDPNLKHLDYFEKKDVNKPYFDYLNCGQIFLRDPTRFMILELDTSFHYDNCAVCLRERTKLELFIDFLIYLYDK